MLILIFFFKHLLIIKLVMIYIKLKLYREYLRMIRFGVKVTCGLGDRQIMKAGIYMWHGCEFVT